MVSTLTGYWQRRWALSVLVVVTVYMSLAADAVAQGSVETDRATLAALYDATGGEAWPNSANWKTAEPLDVWFGVTTDTAGRVILLNLGGNALTGPIPESLGNLSKLRRLNLVGNALTGPIPESLGSLPNLVYLVLDDNALTGPIPESLGSLSNLYMMSLANNTLTGPIPESLGSLSNLYMMSLANNTLTGPIPESLGSLSNLGGLHLDDNELIGPIPDGLGNLSNLSWLDLGGNALTGPIPDALGLLPLQYLRLGGNVLTGPIPDALGLLPVQWLDLGGNALTGPIPDALGRPYHLQWLDLGGNELTGSIPAAMGSLVNLELLDLAGNALAGPLPSELTRLWQLTELNIQDTGLCAPADSPFREWLARMPDFFGSACPQAPGSFFIPFSDGGGRSITSSGTDETLRIGYGKIRAGADSTTPPGIAIFQFRDSDGVLISEAGVPAVEAVQEGRIFAEVNGPVTTGLAIANPNEIPATIRFYFTDTSGTRFANGSFDLGANQQTAKFLDQAPFNGGPSVLGTLTFTASVPVAVIAIRGLINEAGEFLMTTLPVAPLIAPLSPFSTDTVYFSHFADGSGWATQVILVNPTIRTITGTVEFLRPSSETTAAALAVLTLDDGQTGSSFAYSIPPRSSHRLITSNPPGALAVGSVRATPHIGNAAPMGVLVFSFASGGKTVSEAGVPALPKGSAFRLYVEVSGPPRHAGSVRSGLAIANVGVTATTVTLGGTYLDGSLALWPRATLELPPSGQIARFLDEIFALPDNFSGVLRVTSPDEVAIVGLRLRVNEKGEIKMTTTPPSNEMDVSTTAETFFPHLADSGGWSTQFILYSGTAGQASSGTLRFIDATGQPLDLSISKSQP